MSFRMQSLVSIYRRGYAEAEIMATCSKYDLDKGHVLSAAEILHRMQVDDLNRKKVKSSAFSLNCHLTSDLHGNAFVVVSSVETLLLTRHDYNCYGRTSFL